MKKFLLSTVMLICTLMAFGQIWEPNGLNIPGTWNGWTQPLPNNSAFASSTQIPGGGVVKITTGTLRWQTIFNVAASGADATGGSHNFLFTSGPTSNYWADKWANVNVTMNTLQTYTYQGGTDNSITVTNGKWYTMNWIDNGYNNTQAIFMETSAEPVTFSSVSQSPTNGNVTATDNVIITVTASATPSPEELVYVRYSSNGFSTSSLEPVSFTGNVGTATIPAHAPGSQVDYYVFSTTVSNPAAADVDKVTINFKNNGTGNYTYTVNTPLPPVNVTFQVDMSQQVVAGAVNIAGTFTGWATTAMTNAGGGLYTYTTSLNQNQAISYKFVNGASFEGNLGAPCGDGSNRTYNTGTSDSTIPVVCFGSCTTCPPMSSTTFQVNMSNEVVGGNVYINGNFPAAANWTIPQLMTNAGGGIYTYTTSLPQGSGYSYKYINGASYEGNLGAPCGNGNDRTITVPATPSNTQALVCFGSCSNCVAPPATHAVTFRVNMGDQTVSPNGVHLAGSFGAAGYPQWSPNGIPMTDANADGIYDVTLNLPDNTGFEYKFINGNDWPFSENVPGGCNTFGNRTMTTTSLNLMLPVLCYGQCSNCGFVVFNDGFTSAATTPSSGTAFPAGTCYTSTLVGTTVSTQGNAANVQGGGGQDVWYKIVAPSTALRVVTTTSSMNIVLELHNASGAQVDVENDVAGIGGEIMSTGGLTKDATYYIAVRSFDGVLGAFTVCVQALMESYPSLGSGTYELCSNMKAKWTGANSYTYNFDPTGATAGSNTSTTGGAVLALSNPTIALRHNGTYDVTVDATYNLTDGAGNNEVITVPGTSVSAFTIAPHASVEVRETQRCAYPATLLRGSVLVGKPYVCGAIGYTVEFTEVTDCSGSTTVGLPFEVATPGMNAALSLSFTNPEQLNNNSYYIVRFRPTFSYGNGTYGNSRVIFIGGSAMPTFGLDEENQQAVRSVESAPEAAVYPNPSNGEMVNVNVTGIVNPAIQISITDNTGRAIYNQKFSVDGTFNRIITFDQAIAEGLYLLQVSDGERTTTTRLIVQH